MANEKKESVKKRNNKKLKNAVMIAVAVLAAIAVIAAVIFVSVYDGPSSPSDDTGAADRADDDNNDTSDLSDDSTLTDNGDLSSDSGTDSSADSVDSVNSGNVTGSSSVSKDSYNSSDSSAVSSDVGSSGDSSYDENDDISELTTEDDIAESQLIVAAGKTASDWPSSLPTDIPVFSGSLEFTNNCIYEKHSTQEIWYMGWNTNENDYNNWIKQITAAGFKASSKVVGFYANGEYLLDIMTEDGENGSLWVSMDVYHSFDIEYPIELQGVVPDFDPDATLEYWYVDEAKRSLNIFYVCPSDWTSDLNSLLNSLVSAGFTMNDQYAIKSVNGNTVTVYWAGSHCYNDNMLVITY